MKPRPEPHESRAAAGYRRVAEDLGIGGLFSADGLAPDAGTDTSREAAEAIAPTAGTLEARVYAYLIAYGPRTRDELEVALRMPGDTLRPRLWALAKRGLVQVRQGDWRLTRAGKRAQVLEAVRAAA